MGILSGRTKSAERPKYLIFYTLESSEAGCNVGLGLLPGGMSFWGFKRRPEDPVDCNLYEL